MLSTFVSAPEISQPGRALFHEDDALKLPFVRSLRGVLVNAPQLLLIFETKACVAERCKFKAHVKENIPAAHAEFRSLKKMPVYAVVII